MKISEIPEFSKFFPIKFPETIIWSNGIPRLILIPLSNKLIKQQAKTASQYLDEYFRKTLKEVESKDFTKLQQNMGKRKFLKRIPISLKYKTILRLREPYNQGVQIVDETLMREIATQWSKSSLKSIQAIHRYVDNYDKNASVIRVKYYVDGYKQILIPLAEKCYNALVNLIHIIREQCKVKIVKMKAEFIASDKEYLLYNAWDITYEFLINDSLLKNPVDLGMRSKLKDNLIERLAREAFRNKNKWNYIQSIIKTMDKHVKDTKEYIGLRLKVKSKSVSKKSEDVFRKLHPDFNKTFSQVLSLTKRIAQVPQSIENIPKERSKYILTRNGWDEINWTYCKSMPKITNKWIEEIYKLSENNDKGFYKSNSRINIGTSLETTTTIKPKAIFLTEDMLEQRWAKY